jgi:gluconolactonase
MEYELVTDGLVFPEGPVWMKDGSVIVVETCAGRLTRVWPDGKKETVAEPGGGPNGAAIGPDGFIYVVNNGGMELHRRDGLMLPGGPTPDYKGGWLDKIDIATGKVERLYTECDGRRLSAPNDIVFDYEGGIWFTDFGKPIGHTVENGGILYAKPDGSLIKRAIDGPRPNGIGISPDGKTIYAAMSFEMLLVAFDIIGPGELGPIADWTAGRPVGQFAPQQLLDSLAVLANGDVCVGTCVRNTGIGSINPATGALTDYPFDDILTTNICFGGDDMQDAWVTLSTTGRLVKCRWPTPGLRLAHYA